MNNVLTAVLLLAQIHVLYGQSSNGFCCHDECSIETTAEGCKSKDPSIPCAPTKCSCVWINSTTFSNTTTISDVRCTTYGRASPSEEPNIFVEVEEKGGLGFGYALLIGFACCAGVIAIFCFGGILLVRRRKKRARELARQTGARPPAQQLPSTSSQRVQRPILSNAEIMDARMPAVLSREEAEMAMYQQQAPPPTPTTPMEINLLDSSVMSKDQMSVRSRNSRGSRGGRGGSQAGSSRALTRASSNRSGVSRYLDDSAPKTAFDHGKVTEEAFADFHLRPAGSGSSLLHNTDPVTYTVAPQGGGKPKIPPNAAKLRHLSAPPPVPEGGGGKLALEPLTFTDVKERRHGVEKRKDASQVFEGFDSTAPLFDRKKKTVDIDSLFSAPMPVSRFNQSPSSNCGSAQWSGSDFSGHSIDERKYGFSRGSNPSPVGSIQIDASLGFKHDSGEATPQISRSSSTQKMGRTSSTPEPGIVAKRISQTVSVESDHEYQLAPTPERTRNNSVEHPQQSPERHDESLDTMAQLMREISSDVNEQIEKAASGLSAPASGVAGAEALRMALANKEALALPGPDFRDISGSEAGPGVSSSTSVPEPPPRARRSPETWKVDLNWGAGPGEASEEEGFA